MRTNRRIVGLLVLFVAAVALLIGGLKSSHAQGGNSSSHDFAVGGFTAMDLSHVAFAAQVNPQDPTQFAGHVVQEDASGTSRSGPVQCVGVNGSNAVVVWQVKNSDTATEVNTFRSFDVTDNGPPQMGMSPDLYKDNGQCNNDSMTLSMLPPCSCSCPKGGCIAVLRGNIVVNDAP